ncbi:MAG: hypothetical protein HZB57_06020 [Gammaproteobacteria bacterium]|nr:hypothetical protein [Gammaproteobacteria bacterium]
MKPLSPTLFIHLIALLILALHTVPANAESRSDYLFFANLTGTHNASVPAGVDLDHKDWEPAATFLYTQEAERLRLFTELHAAKEGEGEIARLQAGWRFTPQTTLWAGRFHNPQGYWNTQYHHGTYLQTSISRPGIERFDDEGGVLPSHFIGLQLDGTEDIGADGGLRYEFALVASGVLSEEGLESPAFFMPQRSSKSTASLRATYTPTEGGPLTLGAFLGRNQLPADDLAVREVTQVVYGTYATLDLNAVRLIGAITALNNELELTGRDTTGSFANAYAQAEYLATPVWSVYGRIEGTSGDDNDPYLALFPRYVRNQGVAGLRWDLYDKQALKLEYSNPQIAAGRYEAVAVEWSMIFP